MGISCTPSFWAYSCHNTCGLLVLRAGMHLFVHILFPEHCNYLAYSIFIVKWISSLVLNFTEIDACPNLHSRAVSRAAQEPIIPDSQSLKWFPRTPWHDMAVLPSYSALAPGLQRLSPRCGLESPRLCSTASPFLPQTSCQGQCLPTATSWALWKGALLTA